MCTALGLVEPYGGKRVCLSYVWSVFEILATTRLRWDVDIERVLFKVNHLPQAPRMSPQLRRVYVDAQSTGIISGQREVAIHQAAT